MPKFLNPKEEAFWRHRFDPMELLSITQIEEKYHLDRSYLRSGAAKLIWNAEHGFLTLQSQTLVEFALQTTAVEVEGNKYLIEELIARRAQHVNWEKRYRKNQD